MKVLYVIDPGTVGGAAESFVELIRLLSSKKIECIVCVSSDSKYNKRIESAGGQVIITGHAAVMEPKSPYRWKRPIKYPLRWLQYRHKTRKALKILRYTIDISTVDLIHTNSARNDLGCFINKVFGIPHIVHLREFGDLDFECIMLNRKYIEIMNMYTTGFISISKAVGNHWIKKGIQENKIKIIYNGIHTDDIEISNSEAKDIENIKMVIAGGICEAKGQLLIVEAINKLPIDIRNKVSVDMLGWNDPHYLNRIEEKINKYGLQDNINIIGPVNDVHKRLKDYQIGLTCSRSEGFGRVTAEYMHAQLGVIASDSGANPELIEDGQTGLLFESGNSDSLAENIMKFYYDRKLLKECSRKAKEKATAEYTDVLNSERIFKLYQEVVHANQ